MARGINQIYFLLMVALTPPASMHTNAVIRDEIN